MFIDGNNDNSYEDERKERFLHLVEALLAALESGEMYEIFETDNFGNRNISQEFISEYKELIDVAIAEELDHIRSVADQERQAIEVMVLLLKSEAQVALEQRLEQCQRDIEERVHEIFKRHAEENGLEYDTSPKKSSPKGYVYEDDLTLETLTPERLADFDRRLQEAKARIQKNKERGWGLNWLFLRNYAPC